MLSETQKKVLKLSAQGKKSHEIAKIEGIKEKSVSDVLKRGKSNLDRNIGNIKFAIGNHLLSDEQILSLRSMLKDS